MPPSLPLEERAGVRRHSHHRPNNNIAYHHHRNDIDMLPQVSLFLLVFVLSSPLLAQEPTVKSIDDYQGLPTRIAFGSCSKQFKPQPILRKIVEKRPDLFIYLGDNIYADTYDMQVIRDKYDELGSKPEFQTLREKVTVLSTWDDHDYGANDAGKEYPRKAESREIFFDFWKVP